MKRINSFYTLSSFCGTLIISLTFATLLYAIQIDNISFLQADWFDGDGTLHVADSSWGRMDFDLIPDATDIYYLNVSALSTGGSDAWIVQNLPLFSADIGSADPRQSVDFDIKELGVSVGDALGSIEITYTITPSILISNPTGPATVFSVDSIDYLMAGGTKPTDVPFEDPGSPAGHKADAEVKKEDVIQHKNVPGVQEGNKRCLAGAFARSIGWLNVEYKLGSEKTAQQVYNDLRAKDVGSTTGDATVTTYEQDIKAKDTYLKTIHASETKIRDLSNGIDDITGVDEDTTTDPIEWLRAMLKTEDVELDYGRHIVTITSVWKQGDKTFIKFRDDEKQGNDAVGDSSEKEAQIYKSGDKYYFRAKDSKLSFQIRSLIAESIIPEPGTIILLGIAIMGLARKALK